jgi:phage regulator Rha-like protein
MTKKEILKVIDTKIVDKIYMVRGQKVMLDRDLAEMYGVETKNLNQAIKRNLSRFPEDFMFQLTKDEHESLRLQIGTSKEGRGGVRYLPYAFTEQGVAMLSSVLSSDTAIQVNIQIIRVFTKMKQALLDNKEILLRIEKIEKKMVQHDEGLETIFKVLKKLLQQPEPKNRESIGFPYPNKK